MTITYQKLEEVAYELNRRAAEIVAVRCTCTPAASTTPGGWRDG